MKVINDPKTLLFSIAVIVSNCVYGQSLIFGDDYKKELWKTIDPGKKSPLTTPKTLDTSKKDDILNNKYIYHYSNYKYKSLEHLLEVTKSQYKLNPNILIYNGKTPLNQLPAGSTALVYMGGHFCIVNTGGSLIFPSGLDLSGGGTKKLSEKSRSILTNVYGLEIEE